MTDQREMTTDEIRAHGDRLGVPANWGRWGADDERGTLNLVDGAAVLRAIGAVRTGTVLDLGRPLDVTAPPYYPQGLDVAVRHEMVTAWGSNAGGDVQAASDQLHVQCHGLDNTHMDALCHIGFGGVGYNGRAFREMVDMTGAAACDMLAAGPVVTRGVLVDVPRLRGVDHLAGGEPVTDDDLRAAAPDVRPGRCPDRAHRPRPGGGRLAECRRCGGAFRREQVRPDRRAPPQRDAGGRRAGLRTVGHRRLRRHLPGGRRRATADPRPVAGVSRAAPAAQPGPGGTRRRARRSAAVRSSCSSPPRCRCLAAPEARSLPSR